MSNIQTWLYLDENNDHKGPFSPEELLDLAKSQTIDKSTYVWTEVLTEWIHAEQVEGLFPEPVAATPEKSSMSFTVPLERDNTALKRETIDIGLPMAPKPSKKSRAPKPAPQARSAADTGPLTGGFSEPQPAVKKQSLAEQVSEPCAVTHQDTPPVESPSVRDEIKESVVEKSEMEAKPMIEPLNLPIQPRKSSDVTSHRVGEGIQCGSCGAIIPTPISAITSTTQCSQCKSPLFLPEEKCLENMTVQYVILAVGIIVGIGLIVIGMKSQIGLVGGIIAALVANLLTFASFFVSEKKNKQTTIFNANVRKQIVKHESEVARTIAQKA